MGRELGARTPLGSRGCRGSHWHVVGRGAAGSARNRRGDRRSQATTDGFGRALGAAAAAGGSSTRQAGQPRRCWWSREALPGIPATSWLSGGSGGNGTSEVSAEPQSSALGRSTGVRRAPSQYSPYPRSRRRKPLWQRQLAPRGRAAAREYNGERGYQRGAAASRPFSCGPAR